MFVTTCCRTRSNVQGTGLQPFCILKASEISREGRTPYSRTAYELQLVADKEVQKGKLSRGQAKRLDGLDQLIFQKEPAKRDVYIHFSMEELEDDLETLRNL